VGCKLQYGILGSHNVSIYRTLVQQGPTRPLEILECHRDCWSADQTLTQERVHLEEVWLRNDINEPGSINVRRWSQLDSHHTYDDGCIQNGNALMDRLSRVIKQSGKVWVTAVDVSRCVGQINMEVLTRLVPLSNQVMDK
jgi:hypothetical protein